MFNSLKQICSKRQLLFSPLNKNLLNLTKFNFSASTNHNEHHQNDDHHHNDDHHDDHHGHHHEAQ